MRKLSFAVLEALNDPAKIAKRDLWFRRMENVFAGREDEYNKQYVFTLFGRMPRPANRDLVYTAPEEWVLQSLELLAQPESTGNYFAPNLVYHPIYGVHFIDRIFGANVYNNRGQWHADYLESPVGELQMPDLETNETWAKAKLAAMAFLESGVQEPLFVMPTLSSALNIFINLYGGDGLIAMMEDEEAALHDLTMINDVIRTLHRWYIEHVPAQQLQCIGQFRVQPPGSGQLCGCSCHLLSGKLYRELIAPLDDAVLGEYPNGGMIHLCGSHTQHIPAFREMKNLRVLQLNDRAAEDLPLYLEGLREDQLIYLNPCEGMPVEKAVEISKGKRIILCETKEAPKMPH